ncbi:type VI secretion system baseplate subunit TssG [Photobacterium aquae]|uniref:type VI secretion system baseplate subunit TssG n=1 Tax=Photobacterium aquae TaxID=1195763 RepID=UPI00069FCE56|nr:type VI secretion system baseplate subunit TssG [Photobacterium aquae]
MNITQLIGYIDRDDFYRSVYSLQRQMSEIGESNELGTDTLPNNECIRFKACQTLGFAGTAIESIRETSSDSGVKRLDININFMGLTGPSGALPRHYTELVMQRARLKDVAIREFFDMFNHRLISLQYRSWEKYQYPIQHERYLNGKESIIDSVLHALTGATHNLDVFMGGLLAKTIRNSQSLRQILTLIGGCQVEIKEFVGRWLQLSPSEQTCLGSRLQPEGQHAQLGVSSMLGQRVWDLSSAIDIELHVNEREKAAMLMNQGPLLQTMKQIVSHYLSPSIHVSWRLVTAYQNLPVASLNNHGVGLGLGVALMSSHHIKDKVLKIPVG